MAGAGPVAKIEGACLAKVRTHLRSRSKIAVRIARFILKSPAAVARHVHQQDGDDLRREHRHAEPIHQECRIQIAKQKGIA